MNEIPMETPLASTPAPPLSSSIPEVAFVLELGRAMQTFGVSVSTLETALGRVSQHLGLEGAVFATPTGFLASLRLEGHHSKTYLMRGNAAGGLSSLDQLAQAEALVDRVLDGELDVHAAREHLASICAHPGSDCGSGWAPTAAPAWAWPSCSAAAGGNCCWARSWACWSAWRCS